MKHTYTQVDKDGKVRVFEIVNPNKLTEDQKKSMVPIGREGEHYILPEITPQKPKSRLQTILDGGSEKKG